MAEQTFYDQAGIKVTSARLVFGQQTFQLSGITSVRPQEIPPNRNGPIILMIVGLLCTAGLGTIAGIIWWFTQKTTYAVILVSAAGETSAYTSLDKNEVFQIANAVNEAMAARG
jgi:hypothetical protein